MALRFTRHAGARLVFWAITEAEVSLAIETAYRTIAQADTLRYHAVIGERRLGVVVKRNTEPRLVVTVFVLRDGVE